MSFLRDITNRQRAAMQQFSVQVIEEPEVEAISLEDAYVHCGIDTFTEGSPPETASAFDGWLTNTGIPAAREFCEAELEMSLAPRTLEVWATGFPTRAASTPPGTSFPLRFGPVQEIVSVTYLDQAAADAAYQVAYDAEFLISSDVDLATAAGEAAAAAALEQTMDAADYTIDRTTTPAGLILAHGASWPTARSEVGSVKVRYVAGFSVAGDSPGAFPLPKMAKASMLEMLAHLWAHRGDDSADMPPTVERMLRLVPGYARMGMA
jgi:hypothetical protein